MSVNAQAPNWQWARGVGGLVDDMGLNVAIDQFDNVYTTGYYSGTVDFDPGAGIFNLTASGGTDVYILKLDNAGNFIWAKSIGGLTADVGRSIAFDNTGNVYLTGGFSGTVDFDPGAGTFNVVATGSDDVFILKLNSSGNFIWARAMGGLNSDMGRGIAIDGNENIYTTGSFGATADFDPGVGIFNLNAVGLDDIYIAKLDSAGNLVWAKAMGSPGPDYGKSIAIDDNGNIYTIGEFEGAADFDPGAGNFNLTATSGATNIFISKLDNSGSFVWAKGMIGLAAATGTTIALDASNNIYTTGFFMGTFDLDPGTATHNVTSFDAEEDVFISKLDNAGNYQWAKTFGGMSTDVSNSIALDDSANIYITGGFRFTVDFDPSIGIYNLTPNGIVSIYISKLDSSGNFIFATKAGGTNSDVGRGIAIANSGAVYITGSFGSPSISFGANTITNGSASGNWDAFIAKLQGGTTGIERVHQTNGVSFYPNPTSEYLIIKLNDAPQKTEVTITDINGKTIYTASFSGMQTALVSTKDFVPGIYLCIVNVEGTLITQKIIKD